MIKQARRTLAFKVLSGIEHAPTRNDYEQECGNCGLELLRLLYAQAAKIGVTETTNIHTAMQTTFQTGISSAMVAAFAAFRTVYEGQNYALPSLDRLSEDRLVSRYRLLLDQQGLDASLETSGSSPTPRQPQPRSGTRSSPS